MKLALTNEEKTAKLEAKARKELLKGIARDWQAIESSVNTISQETVKGVNRMRAMGQKFQALVGHEQLSLDRYIGIQDKLPKSMRYTVARAAVHVANRLVEDVKTAPEAFAVQRELWQALPEFKEPRRLEAQTSHESNPWNDFVSGAASFTGLFAKLESEPMESWGSDKLQTFIRTTKPIVERYQRALQLAGGER